MMILNVHDDFSLKKIADSGQCFRWKEMPADTSVGNAPAQNASVGNAPADGTSETNAANDILKAESYRIIAGSRCLRISAETVPVSALSRNTCEVRLNLDCDPAEFDRFWYQYFDFGTCYRNIRKKIIPEEDPFLARAAQTEQGIRILRQDPWETLISFIISQNRNIPAIRRSIELLCASAGEKKTDSCGTDYFAFPTPEQICEMSEQALKDCRLGYRWKYVLSAAEDVAAGRIRLNELTQLAAAGQAVKVIQDLKSIYGVGVKVASCVALFGFHCTDALPIDVWMKKVMAQEYPQGYPYEKYSPYNGIYQQYMFAYYRQRETQQVDNYSAGRMCVTCISP